MEFLRLIEKVIVDEELREKLESVKRVSARPRKCWLVLLIKVTDVRPHRVVN